MLGLGSWLRSTQGILSIVLLIAVGGLIYMFSDLTINDISEVGSIQAVIAFVFSIGIVGIGFMMVYMAMNETTIPFNDRFDLAKQIFTSLLGVFATIVGFYFGTVSQDSGENQTSTEVRSNVDNAGTTGDAPAGTNK